MVQIKRVSLMALILSFLTIFGCSSNQSTKEVVLVSPPNNLLLSPCKPAEAGSTVGSLAEGYVANTGCLWQFEGRMESLRKWKAEQEILYKK